MIFQRGLLGGRPTASFSDNFNRANNPIGAPWLPFRGVWTVASNKAATATDYTTSPLTAVYAGTPNVDLAIDCRSTDALYARVIDADRFIRLRHEHYSVQVPTYTTEYKWEQRYSGEFSSSFAANVHTHTSTLWATPPTPPSFPFSLHTHAPDGGGIHTKVGSSYFTGETRQITSGYTTVHKYRIVLEGWVTSGSTAFVPVTVYDDTTLVTDIRMVLSGSSIAIHLNGSLIYTHNLGAAASYYSNAIYHGIGRAPTSARAGETYYNETAIDDFVMTIL